jgi:hypothetical protein
MHKPPPRNRLWEGGGGETERERENQWIYLNVRCSPDMSVPPREMASMMCNVEILRCDLPSPFSSFTISPYRSVSGLSSRPSVLHHRLPSSLNTLLRPRPASNWSRHKYPNEKIIHLLFHTRGILKKPTLVNVKLITAQRITKYKHKNQHENKF